MKSVVLECTYYVAGSLRFRQMVQLYCSTLLSVVMWSVVDFDFLRFDSVVATNFVHCSTSKYNYLYRYAATHRIIFTKLHAGMHNQ
jgi:hypothetical protein